jgi:type II secretory pathway pseudopilin PulG
MNPAPKALAHGVLIFLEIIVVVLFVISLAAIAMISSLGARKRNRALENANALHLIGLASDHRVD